MPGFIERILNAVLLGLLPPIPLEMRADYAKADPVKQEQFRSKYVQRHLRWARVVSGVAFVMIVKVAWEYGWLAFLGLGGGVAHTGDIDQLRTSQVQMQTSQLTAAKDLQSFKNLYQQTVVQDRIRIIDSEKFQLEVAIAAAVRAGREPDTLHQQRLVDLKGERERLVKQMDALATVAAKTQ